jgi:hypothetical protein
MHILQWISGYTRRDRVWNDEIHERLGVTLVKEKLVQHCLRFAHFQRRLPEAPVLNRVISRSGNGKRDRGRPNMT